MTLKIDLRTRTLPSDPDVFLVRPGAGYHLYDAASGENLIAVDIPFLDIPDAKPLPDASDIAPMLERARLMRVWARMSAKRRGAVPTKSLTAYSTYLEDRGPKMTRTKLRNAANMVLWEIPDNSLIYIPAPNLGGHAILAEAGKRKASRLKVNGGGARAKFDYLARPISSVKQFPMRDLPPDVTDPGQKLLVHNQFEGYAKERLLRAYYGNYQRGADVSVVEFVAGAAEFDTKVIAQVSALAMSIEHHLETGQFIHPREFVFGFPAKRGPQLHARINSKDGKAQVEDSSIVPHVVKAVLLVSTGAIASAAVAFALTTGNAEVMNTSLQGGQDIVEATNNALIDYAAAAGAGSMAEIIENLAVSIENTDGAVDGQVIGP